MGGRGGDWWSFNYFVCGAKERRREREVEDGEGRFAATLKTRPEQSSRLEFKEFQQALAKIPADQREALILVGASGFSMKKRRKFVGVR